MRVVLSQINTIIGDMRGNTLKILHGIEKAKAAGADLVVFPELSIVGYPPEDFVLLSQFVEDAEIALNEIVHGSKGVAVIVGVVRKNPSCGEKSLYNSAAIIDDGKLLGFQDKMLLPTYDVFDERRFFEPAEETIVWEIAGKKVGVTICEDIWQHSAKVRYANYTRDPVRELALLTPDLVVNLSASPFSLNKFSVRLEVCSAAARTLKCPLLLCNQVGGNDSLIFDGRSLFIHGDGTFGGCAKVFSEDDYIVDTDSHDKVDLPQINLKQELYGALVLGLRDYFHKSGFKKACLGLSGGVDSAVVACLAVEALGKENVLGVLMPSRYSSEGSITDARELAETLGIPTQKIPIEGPFVSYLELMGPVFERYDCSAMDTTEENMQARIRGMILMALSNKLGYIVLSTGNKSELAMGYATLYGDMCGGLCVLSDVTKQQVYELANWINRDRIVIPVNTITKAPSAELRPNQKDTDSLPEYSVVDTVLEAYIEGHEAAASIAKRHGYPIELVKDLVTRIHRNEYKRRQGPLGLRVSEKAFSVGRHFPVVQKYI